MFSIVQIKAFKLSRTENIKHMAHTVRCDVVDFMVEEFAWYDHKFSPSCLQPCTSINHVTTYSKVTVSLSYEDLRSELPTQTKVVIWPLASSVEKHPSACLDGNKPKVTPISLLYAERILKEEHLPRGNKMHFIERLLHHAIW